MFNNIDKSPFDDSTGLKFLEYLKRKEDGGTKALRSRKQLFQLQGSDVSEEDFSIRKVAEKENSQTAKAAASSVARPRTPQRTPSVRKDRSSVFKPGFMSTPMVPTTAQTPYRASKKSVGIQNSPLVELPLSQEPEIPETPEVAVAAKSVVAAAVPPTRPSIIPPPAQFSEQPQQIYPDLENVVQQQQALPIVLTSTAVERSMANAKEPAVTVCQQPAIVTHPPTPLPIAAPPLIQLPPPTPQTETVSSQSPAPSSQKPRVSIRVISPERLMEIIHQEPPVVNTPAAPVVETPTAPVQSPIATTEQRGLQTPRNLAEEMVIPAALSPSPLPPPSPPASCPPSNETIPATQEIPESQASEPATPRNVATALNDSSFFAVPTPVLRNFKLVVNDCMKSSEAEQRTAVMPAPPEPRLSTAVNRKKEPKKMCRASELTIPNTSRCTSTLVPSTQKRRLHSVVRELTPIRSPITTQHNHSTRDQPQPVEAMELPAEEVAPEPTEQEPQETTKRGRAKKPVPSEEAKRPVGRPKGKKTVPPSEEERTGTTADDYSEDSPRSPLAETSNRRPGPKSKQKTSEEAKRKRGPSKGKKPAQPLAEAVASDADAEDSPQSPLAQEVAKKSTRRPGPKSKTQRQSEVVNDGVGVVRDDRPTEIAEIINDWRDEEPPVPAIEEALFKKPAAPAPKKRPAKRATRVREEAEEEDAMETTGMRRSNRTVKTVREVLPFYMADMLTDSRPIEKGRFTSETFKRFCKTLKPEPDVVKKKSSSSASTKSAASSTAAAVSKKKRTKAPPETVTSEEAFDALRDNREEQEITDTAAAAATPQLEPIGEVEELVIKRPRSSRKEREGKAVSKSGGSSSSRGSAISSVSTSVQQQSTYNFSKNLMRASSTGLDWDATSQVTITRTLDICSLPGMAEERVRHQDFSGGYMMIYPGYTQGIIVLNSKKERARVKKKPLVLNVITGTIIVNLESEQGAVRITKLDEILIPRGMWYSLENIGEGSAVLMFTWV